jgi:hypothetical protein
VSALPTALARFGALAVLSTAFLCSSGCGRCCSGVEAPLPRATRSGAYADPYPAPMPFEGKPLAIVGDVQRTSWLERVFLGRRRNDREQQILLADLNRSGAGPLLLLGDLTFDAGDPSAWSRFDGLLAPIARGDRPVLAIRGNHDYWGDPGRSNSELYRRFPALHLALSRVVRYGQLALVLLDSNRDELPAASWQHQLSWYEQTLAALDEDPSVSGVLVAMHHPPFTESTTVANDTKFSRPFVAAFEHSNKTLAMLSGHAHGYECWSAGKKHYLISAGGGGPLQPRKHAALAPSAQLTSCQYADVRQPLSSQLFNFLLVSQTSTGIGIEVRGVAPDAARVARLGTLLLPWQASIAK